MPETDEPPGCAREECPKSSSEIMNCSNARRGIDVGQSKVPTQPTGRLHYEISANDPKRILLLQGPIARQSSSVATCENIRLRGGVPGGRDVESCSCRSDSTLHLHLSVRLSPQGTVALSTDGASAEIGRPLTAGSVAGVHRRAHRRAYRRGYYASDYGTYQPYGTYQYGYAYQPGWRYDRNRYYQQPYSGYGYRHWSEF